MWTRLTVTECATKPDWSTSKTWCKSSGAGVQKSNPEPLSWNSYPEILLSKIPLNKTFFWRSLCRWIVSAFSQHRALTGSPSVPRLLTYYLCILPFISNHLHVENKPSQPRPISCACVSQPFISARFLSLKATFPMTSPSGVVRFKVTLVWRVPKLSNVYDPPRSTTH